MDSCISHYLFISISSSFCFSATSRVLKGESRSCRWTRVPPLQGERGLFQCCQCSRSLIKTKQCTSRYRKVKKTGTGTQESFPWGTLHHRFTRQGLFKNVKQFNRLGLVSCNHGSSTNICEVPLIHTSHSAAVAEMPWEAATSESGKISLGLFCHYCRLSLLILFVSYVLISFSSLSLSIYRMWTY